MKTALRLSLALAATCLASIGAQVCSGAEGNDIIFGSQSGDAHILFEPDSGLLLVQGDDKDNVIEVSVTDDLLNADDVLRIEDGGEVELYVTNGPGDSDTLK